MSTRIVKSPYPRYRERGSTSVPVAGGNILTACNGTGLTPDYPILYGHREGEVEGCDDIVTPEFRRLSAEGHVVNSPYRKVKQSFLGGGTGPIVVNQECGSLPPTTRKIAEYPSSARHFFAEYKFGEVRADGKLIPPVPSLIDLDRLMTLAQTSCMANVDTGSTQALVTAAEARRTASMLARPLEALDRYTAKQLAYLEKEYQRALVSRRGSTKLRSTRNPGGLRDALASQYLSYYYGMRPLAKDLENSLNAYLREGSTPQRETARGKASDTKTRITLSPAIVYGSPGTKYQHKYTLVEEVDVHAGCLYTPTSNSYPKQFGLRFSDLPSFLWEATTLSFLADYFLNIGNVIRALEPRMGIQYLANWITVRRWTIDRSEVIATAYGTASHTIARPSTEWAARVVVSTERYPLASPYSYVGFAVKNYDGGLQRNLAIAALISQRVNKIAGIYGAFAIATL